jgi:hypothetical protein
MRGYWPEPGDELYSPLTDYWLNGPGRDRLAFHWSRYMRREHAARLLGEPAEHVAVVNMAGEVVLDTALPPPDGPSYSARWRAYLTAEDLDWLARMWRAGVRHEV